MVRNNRERVVHAKVCDYLRLQYPEVIFTSEPSGIFVTFNQAKELKRLRSHSGLPDLWILCPRGKYHGMFLELKADEYSPWTKKGILRKTEHIQRQALTLKRLLSEGYYANFSIGFEHSQKQIDAYMQGLDMEPYYLP